MLQSRSSLDIEMLMELSLGSPIGQFRAAPVRLGAGAPRAFAAVYGADQSVDPAAGAFFYPTDTLKLLVFAEEGTILWKRDLGRGVVPGVWFCPMFPFDLDNDGVDEIWYVANPDEDHPFALNRYHLECVDAKTGRTLGRWPWPHHGLQRMESMGYAFRNFILGGTVHGQPVLVTAQGTYQSMYLQGWRPDMTQRWSVAIPKDAPGARGSHMCPVTDLDQDGIDEVMWGERCIELDTGTEVFCADRDVYRGHSDVIQPVWDTDSGEWFFYTCRESDPGAVPRVVLFDRRGRRVWGKLGEGHIDMGWVARLGENGRKIAMAIRIGSKSFSPQGLSHAGCEEFAFDALSGEDVNLPFSVYRTVPVDMNGDGYHELFCWDAAGGGRLIDRHGNDLVQVGGRAAMASKFLDRPGEQLLTFHADGWVRIWGDQSAQDTPEACRRYQLPAYSANQRLTASGANLSLLGGV